MKKLFASFSATDAVVGVSAIPFPHASLTTAVIKAEQRDKAGAARGTQGVLQRITFPPSARLTPRSSP